MVKQKQITQTLRFTISGAFFHGVIYRKLYDEKAGGNNFLSSIIMMYNSSKSYEILRYKKQISWKNMKPMPLYFQSIRIAMAMILHQ